MLRLVAVVALIACGARSSPHAVEPAPAAPVEDATLAAEIEGFLAGHLAFRPGFAVELGLHEHDGKVPDRSRAAIAAEIARLRAARTTFEAIAGRALSRRSQLEREVVLAEIRKELFELEDRRRPFRDPFYYLLRGFSLQPYLARDYAPAPQRAAAMLRACRGGPVYYRQAADNLEPALPRAWLQVGLMITRGTLEFVRGDARQAFPEIDVSVRSELHTCLDELATAVAGFAAALEARLPAATDEFRLGADNLVAMLRATEGLELDLARLERLARADLERNRAAIANAAAKLALGQGIVNVVAEVSADKPAPDEVLAVAREQVTRLEKLVRDKDLVSIPRDDRVEVRASPSFMRGNFAALGGVGPFEAAPLPSFYFIAPPDPAWPEPQQRAYVQSRHDLLFVTAHEVWPGHFVQGMHQRASGSRVLQMFETYTTSEGWAHYVEEMMWEQGLGDGDPRAHIGQLKNALLRDVRFVVALGYHAGTMTIEEATRLFIEEAFADPSNARQQAMRGTVDPMFLGYTLGKLAILELRADWQAAHPGATLRAFHDELLSYGEAPLPVIRAMMLGGQAGPPLAR
jgi:uncharacterized protein (DUF885 family)